MASTKFSILNTPIYQSLPICNGTKKVYFNIDKPRNGEDELLILHFYTSVQKPLTLHWGLGINSLNLWEIIDSSFLSINSMIVDDKAIQTPFNQTEENQVLTLQFPIKLGIKALNFVFYEEEEKIWHNNNEENYQIILQQEKFEEPFDKASETISDIIHSYISSNTNEDADLFLNDTDYCEYPLLNSEKIIRTRKSSLLSTIEDLEEYDEDLEF